MDSIIALFEKVKEEFGKQTSMEACPWAKNFKKYRLSHCGNI